MLRDNSAPRLKCSKQGEHPTAATESGFRTVHALPMRLRSQVIGALNLFLARPGVLSPEDVTLGRGWPTSSRSACCRYAQSRINRSWLNSCKGALISRVLIQQAKVMLRQGQGIVRVQLGKAVL